MVQVKEKLTSQIMHFKKKCNCFHIILIYLVKVVIPPMLFYISREL